MPVAVAANVTAVPGATYWDCGCAVRLGPGAVTGMASTVRVAALLVMMPAEFETTTR